MNKNHQKIIGKTTCFVKEKLKNAEGGHDWWHIERVRKTALTMADGEKVDLTVLELGALLHDIADPKFHNGNEEIGPKTAVDFLKLIDVDGKTIEHVEKIIRNISFKNTFEGQNFTSPELQIIQDADRLDAIGAIGIARTFNYGGHKGTEIHNPDINPIEYKTKEEYKNSNAPTINHFYEKLLLLKDKMNTKKGKKMAKQRHKYMLNFLEQFYKEWNGEV
jgi:uncharacterized protein